MLGTAWLHRIHTGRSVLLGLATIQLLPQIENDGYRDRQKTCTTIALLNRTDISVQSVTCAFLFPSVGPLSADVTLRSPFFQCSGKFTYTARNERCSNQFRTAFVTSTQRSTAAGACPSQVSNKDTFAIELQITTCTRG